MIDGLSALRERAAVESARLFSEVIDQATGMAAAKRREEIDRICDTFRRQHGSMGPRPANPVVCIGRCAERN